MGEVLTNANTQPSINPEQQGSHDGSLSYRERLRMGLNRLADRSMSMIDLAASIALARDDLRLTRNAMHRLDEPFGGIIERQASADRLSMELESDIIMDFRRDAQRIGFADTDSMPSEARATLAEQSVGSHAGALAAELAAVHPEWTAEEIQDATAARIADVSTLFGMNAEQRDAYMAAQLEYLKLEGAIPEMQATLSELRAERNERMSRIGGVALRGVVNFAGRVRDLPNALTAHAMLAGMAVSDRIHTMSSEKRHKTFWGTAAGVALAGLASYVAVRHGVGSGSSSNNYTLAGSNTALLPDHAGTVLPTHAGSIMPNHAGTPNVLPTRAGTPAPTPSRAGTVLPNHAGTATAVPNHAGSTTPNHVGTGGVENLVGAKTTNEFFASSGSVKQWPDTITVSPWNSHDLDGSLTGISRQMLIRSGVHGPTELQIDTLVQALRPQAQPNGYLLRGQTLDLRPATTLLHDLLNK